ncbi:hypothetical protein MTO96_051129 [Rhipicephalus appendiculatus]
MAQPTKRRKLYLERDGYFDVPQSARRRHDKAHANAVGSTAQTAQAVTGAAPGNAVPASSVCDASDDGNVDDVCAEEYSDHDCSGSSQRDSDEAATPDGDESCTSDYDCSDDNGHDSTGPFNNDEALPAWFTKRGHETLANSNLTKAGALVSVISFAVSHGLTWSALGDLTKLINLLLGADALPRSKFLLRQLWAKKVEDTVQHHFFCEHCKCSMTEHDGSAQCTNCHRVKAVQALKDEGSFFVILNLKAQLKFVIYQTKEELHDNLDALQQPSTTIHGITRAQCYKNLREEQHVGPDDLTLTINTDGSPVWKSSKTSVWPLQFIINELPPHIRFKNPVLAGLWFGRTHPQMQLFLQKFVEEVNSTEAVCWQPKGNARVSKPHVLCVSVDAPARASVQNMVTFNGYFGCTWCVMRGEHKEGSLRYTTGFPAEARTSSRVKEEMELATVLKDTVNGLKGPTALMNLKGLDLVNGYSVEYMHCVLQGVSRQLTETILSSSNSGQRFYSVNVVLSIWFISFAYI